MGEAEQVARRGEGSRARLVFAGALAIALAIAIAGTRILGGGGDEGRHFAPAPERCVEEWNSDSEAVGLGRHQFDAPPSGHGYLHVEVTILNPGSGDELPATDPGGVCALIFASSTLSPEPASAVLIRMDNIWQPLGGLDPDLDRLVVLQQEAQTAYNAQLEADGTITPL